MDVDEAISAAQQAIRFDQDVDPIVVTVLLAVALRAAAVLRAVDDYRADQRGLASFILTGSWQ